MQANRILSKLTVMGAIIFLVSGVAAQAPNSLVYQGRLTTNTGTPITAATNVTFAIYSASTGGSPLWTSGSVSVTPDANGVFTAELLAISAGVFDGTKRYIGITIAGDAEMTPRQLLTSAPYAYNAGAIADNAVTSTKIADGAITNADVNASAAIAASKITGLPGVEYAALSDVSGLTTTLTNLGSITVSCPAAGYVVVSVEASGTIFGENTVVDVGIGTSTSAMLRSSRTGHLDGSATTRMAASFYVTHVLQVNAGDITLYALAQKEVSFSTNTVNLGGILITAMYFPVRY
jgi:hypothetical protein